MKFRATADLQPLLSGSMAGQQHYLETQHMPELTFLGAVRKGVNVGLLRLECPSCEWVGEAVVFNVVDGNE